MPLASAVVALACGSEDAATRLPAPPGGGRDAAAASDGRDALDAGEGSAPPPADASTACPAPRPTSVSTGLVVWARNPETRDCCPYDDYAAAPDDWPYFDTEAQCQSTCRCSVLEGFRAEYDAYNTERSSLECRCSTETCPSSVAEAERIMCSRASFFPVVRREGCGRVMVVDANGLAGDAWIFERPLESTDAGGAGERLIGAGQFGDVPSPACQAYEWVAGASFDCEEATVCQLCGDESAIPPAPPCE